MFVTTKLIHYCDCHRRDSSGLNKRTGIEHQSTYIFVTNVDYSSIQLVVVLLLVSCGTDVQMLILITALVCHANELLN